MNLNSEIRGLLERSTTPNELVSALDRLSRRAGTRVRLKVSGDTVRVGVGREGWYQTEWLFWSDGWLVAPPSDVRFSEALELVLALFDLDTVA